jgi:hypothetical protein
VPAKKVKDIDQSDFAGEIGRISDPYVFLAGLRRIDYLFFVESSASCS